MGRLKRWNPVRRWQAIDLRRVRAKYREARWKEELSVLALIGTMTVTWAGIERVLDELIAWYHHRGGKAVRPDHPRALSLKLDYLKAMEPDIRFSAAERAAMRAIRIETNRLGTERHNLIHGFLFRMPMSADWSVQRVIYKGESASLQSSQYTNRQLQVVVRDMGNLIARLHAFAKPIVQRRGPTEPPR